MTPSQSERDANPFKAFLSGVSAIAVKELRRDSLLAPLDFDPILF